MMGNDWADITLISPYPSIHSFGVRSISAYLKNNGFRTQIVFLPRQFTRSYSRKTVLEVVKLCENSKMVGISLTTNFFDNVVQLTQALKAALDLPILWGGIHATVRPEESLNYADMVCIGEGEESVLDLMTRLRSGETLLDTAGIWFKADGEIIRNKLRLPPHNLDLMPFPDYDFSDHFVLDGDEVERMDEDLLQRSLRGDYRTFATRGCPNRCTYCCNSALHKIFPNVEPVRKRSAENVISELIMAKERMPFLERIYLADDAFFSLSKEYIEHFSREYKEKIGLPFSVSGITPLTCDKEKLELLVDAGVHMLRMGIETGSERIRKLYGRKETNDQILEAVKVISSFSHLLDYVQYDVIVDNPWEKEEDVIQTLKLVAEIPRPYLLSLFSLTLYPGTPLYRKAKKEGIIKNDLEDIYRSHFHDYKYTYLNSLFGLVQYFNFPAWMLDILTEKKYSGLHRCLHALLRIHNKIARILGLMSAGVVALIQGDFSEIWAFFKERFGEVWDF